MDDARISTALPSHPKTKKLIRRIGHTGAWHLVCLFLWAAANRQTGDLAGLTDEDIELAVDWSGEPGAFVAALAEVGFLDGQEHARTIHDWAEHNPWAAGAPARSEASRWAALCKRYGETGAAERMPDHAERVRAARGADAERTRGAEIRSAPLPSPSPSPLPSPRASSASPLAKLPQITAEAVASYNSILGKPHGQLRAVVLVNAVREKQVKRCLEVALAICEHQFKVKEVTREFWDRYFEACADDAFTNGTGPYGGEHKDWRPDFEYLVRPNTVTKVFERAISEVAA